MSPVYDPIPSLKRQLADEILEELKGWSLSWAAWDAHLSRGRISEMRRGNLDNISLDRMVRCLVSMNRSVQIVVTRLSRAQNRPTQSPAVVSKS